MEKNFMTIDVEDWFQVENLKDIIQGQWDDKELRVEANTHKLLDLLDESNTKATFFVLCWIAERCPQLIKDIALRGHEVASHGCSHELVYNQSPEAFKEDIHKAKCILEDMIGKPIYGYRAPSFSITDWATDILVEEEYKYDSSYFAFGGNRYGKLDLTKAERTDGMNIYKLENGLYEYPATTLKLFGKVLPWGGGGYFRLMPYPVFQWGYKKAIRQNGSGMFYLHPWEIDVGQPRVKGLKKGYAFRHYVNLSKSFGKLGIALRQNHYLAVGNEHEKKVINYKPIF